MKNLSLKSAIALSFALSACSLAPQYQRPQIAMPAGWTNVAGVGVSDQPATVPFWQELGSEELNNIMKMALAQNLDLEAALNRIYQARAQTKIAGSSLFDLKGNLLRSFDGQTENHFANFLKAVRSRKTSAQNGPVETAHLASALAHLGNISYRLGRVLNFDPVAEKFDGDEPANAMLTRNYRAPYIVPAKV